MSAKQNNHRRGATGRGLGAVLGIAVFAGAFGLALFRISHSRAIAPPELNEVDIPSTLDGSVQPARLMIPANAARRPLPLLVWLHTWSGDYRQDLEIPAAVRQCREREWIFVQPNFRGANNNPQACGSAAALRDLLDAVAFVQTRVSVDTSRIYLLGESGGGYMGLLAAGVCPTRWSAVSAWVPISDLGIWHQDSHRLGNTYWKDMERCCGGPPGQESMSEYRARSPITHLDRAAGVPIHIYAGIHDGHKGSVPVSHSLLAFNVLARANGQPERAIPDAEIEYITTREQVPIAFVREQGTGSRDQGPGNRSAAGAARRGEDQDASLITHHSSLPVSTQPSARSVEPPSATHNPFDMQVLLHREAGPAEVTIFEGAHEMRVQSAFAWLAAQSRATTDPMHKRTGAASQESD